MSIYVGQTFKATANFGDDLTGATKIQFWITNPDATVSKIDASAVNSNQVQHQMTAAENAIAGLRKFQIYVEYGASFPYFGETKEIYIKAVGT